MRPCKRWTWLVIAAISCAPGAAVQSPEGDAAAAGSAATGSAAGSAAAGSTPSWAEPAPPTDAASSKAASEAPSSAAASSAAAPSSPTALGTLDQLATFPAAGAIVVGPRVLVLSPDFGRVTGVDITTGATIWERALPGTPRGEHVLQRLGDRALLRRGRDMVVIDPASSRIVARHELPMGDRRFLHHKRGMCLMNGACSVQIIDCDDARPLGDLRRGRVAHFHELDINGHRAGGGSRCMGFRVAMFGRVGDLLLYSAQGVEGSSGRHGGGGASSQDVDRLVARHAKTGKIVWERPHRGCGWCMDATSGLSPDGRTGWLVRERELQVFEPRMGALRFKRSFNGEVKAVLWVAGKMPGLFVRTDDSFTLLSPRGQPLYRKPYRDRSVLPLPTDAVLPEHADIVFVGDETHLDWLDHDGYAIERVSIEGRTLLSDEDGRPVLGDHDDARDVGGHVIEGARGARLEVDRSRRQGSGSGPPNQATIRDRATGGALRSIDRDAWLLGEWRDAGGSSEVVHAALMVHDPADQASEVRVLRFTPSGP